MTAPGRPSEKQASAMLDRVGNFFIRIFQAVGHGLGRAVSFVLSPFRWFTVGMGGAVGFSRPCSARSSSSSLRSISTSSGTQLWTELEDQLRASLRIQPMIISNGDESGWLMPAHLATLGFYILRVRSNLVEIRLLLDR